MEKIIRLSFVVGLGLISSISFGQEVIKKKEQVKVEEHKEVHEKTAIKEEQHVANPNEKGTREAEKVNSEKPVQPQQKGEAPKVKQEEKPKVDFKKQTVPANNKKEPAPVNPAPPAEY